MTADAEAEGKVARRRGRLSRRRAEPRRLRKQSELSDNRVSTARRACPASRSYRPGNTARAGRHQYRGILAEQPTCAGAAPSRPRTSDFRRSARHDAVEIRDQRLPKPTTAPEARAGTSERRGRGVYGSCGTSSRRPPRRRRGGGFCLVGELRRPPRRRRRRFFCTWQSRAGSVGYE